jgi:hypothetical protein
MFYSIFPFVVIHPRQMLHTWASFYAWNRELNAHSLMDNTPLLVPEAIHFLNSVWIPSKYDGIWAAWGAWRNGRVIVVHKGIMIGPPFRRGMGRSDLKPHRQRTMEGNEEGSVGSLLWLIVDNQLLQTFEPDSRLFSTWWGDNLKVKTAGINATNLMSIASWQECCDLW